MSDMSGRPWERVAQKYMAHKGFVFIKPRDVTKLDDVPCWYYVYDLPDGVLELEVSWDGKEWNTLVTAFNSA